MTTPRLLAHHRDLPRQTDLARQLRQKQTPAEAALWASLRRKQLDGLQFRRQHPIGPYVVDFCCPATGLVIELDGDIHDEANHAAYDQDRTDYLSALGYRVLRIRNEVVLSNMQSALDRIRDANRCEIAGAGAQDVSPSIPRPAPSIPRPLASPRALSDSERESPSREKGANSLSLQGEGWGEGAPGENGTERTFGERAGHVHPEEQE